MSTLYDALARYQVYVEGLKVGQSNVLAKTMRLINTDIKSKLNGLNKDKLSNMTKAEITSFIATLKLSQSKIYNKYLNDLLEFLQDFMKDDHKLFAAILFNITNKSAVIPDENSSWAQISNYIVPASGLVLPAFVTSFANKSILMTSQKVMQGYAMSQDTKEVIQFMTGQKGLTNSIFNGGKAVSNTAIQAVNAKSQEQVAKSVFKEYQWVSVIDNRTTEICLDLEGQIFTIGDGPLPPAHINCRSHTIYVTEDMPDFEGQSFGAWVKTQSEDFIKDIFHSDEANKIVAGQLKASDIKFGDQNALTLSQFVGKKDIILGK